MDASSASYRYWLLFFACFLTFGSYFCYDLPGALVTHLRRAWLSPFQFNLLNSLYAWPNVFLVFVGGHCVDRVGIRPSMVVCSILVMLGQAIMTVAVAWQSANLLLAGRVIFGSGAETLIVCQSSAISKWFRGKEIAMAFGFSLTLSRLGSIVCFNTLPAFAQTHGLTNAFLVGLLVCGVGTASMYVFLLMDHHAENQRPFLDAHKRKVPAQRDRNGGLSASYWLACSVLSLCYGAIFAFIAVGEDCLSSLFGQLSVTEAARLVSVIYNVSMVFAPVVGAAMDALGRRALVTLIGTLLQLGGFVSLWWLPASFLSPMWIVLMLGAALTAMSSAVWPAIALIVKDDQLGIALGIAQSAQNLGVSISSVLVGILLTKNPDFYVVIGFLSILSLMSVIAALAWNIVDLKTGGAANGTDAEDGNEDTRLLHAPSSPSHIMQASSFHIEAIGLES